MSITVELDPELEATLRDRAARRGLTLEALMAQLAEMEAHTAMTPLSLKERLELSGRLMGCTVDTAIRGILKLGVVVDTEMDEPFWRQAGQIKIMLQSPSLADCFCIALAMRIGATLLTADHPDFEPAARQGLCPGQFIR